MQKGLVVFLLVVVCLVCFFGLGLGRDWDVPGIATMPGVGNEDVVLFVLPDGAGSLFSEAQVKGNGTIIDARIYLTVWDQFEVPLPDFPREDIWLESGDSGLVPCAGGTCPDRDSDENGQTVWENPLRASGNSEDVCHVRINGIALSGAPFTLGFNSADMDGNGVVNLADVTLFSQVFFGSYSFAADFYADGVMNLADVSRLSGGLAASCP